MSTRVLRLLVVPALLFVGIAGLTFGIAQSPPAKPEAEAAAAPGGAGDRRRGEALFAERCAGCHGVSGRNATTGPDLAGNPISLDDARAQIQTGSGVMPPNLVEGQELEDVLAYLETILAGGPLRGED